MNIPKFRAWHKELKRMDSVCELIYKEQNLVLITCYNIGFGYPRSEIELMQWTGFVDKSGKEIYDGDIISNDWDDGYVYCTVFWCNDDGFWKVRQSGSGEIDPLYEMNERVIGNIYENRELLGDKQL